jgi:tripartite-type tricarboxylate transporter receptor subunit TctC
VLAEPAIRTQLLEQGADAVGGTPEALGKVIAAELPKWAKLAKDANIKAD